MLRIDASHGEGGGQLVRTAVALAAITGQAIRLDNVRIKRDKPGLAPQHLAAVRAAAALCSADCEGLELRAQTFSFSPGRLRGGEFRFDVGTAGSVTLVLQALLPVLLCAPGPSRVIVSGGTDVRAAPPLDYFRHVLLELLRQMGATVGCRMLRRGYYPRGGGEVEVSVEPARWRPLDRIEPRTLVSVEGLAHVANLPLGIAERMREAAAARWRVSDHRPASTPSWSDPTRRSAPGARWPAGRGGNTRCWALRAWPSAAAGAELSADLAAGVTLDVHAADQVLIYLALAGGRFSARLLSSHAHTALWLIGQFMPVRFETVQIPGGVALKAAAR